MLYEINLCWLALPFPKQYLIPALFNVKLPWVSQLNSPICRTDSYKSQHSAELGLEKCVFQPIPWGGCVQGYYRMSLNQSAICETDPFQVFLIWIRTKPKIIFLWIDKFVGMKDRFCLVPIFSWVAVYITNEGIPSLKSELFFSFATLLLWRRGSDSPLMPQAHGLEWNCKKMGWFSWIIIVICSKLCQHCPETTKGLHDKVLHK